MDSEVGPVNQFFVDLNTDVDTPARFYRYQTDLFKGLRVVVRQLDFLPHTSGRMRSFDGFDVQI